MWDKRRVVGALVLLSVWVVWWLIMAQPAQPAEHSFRFGCWYTLLDGRLLGCDAPVDPYLVDPEVAPEPACPKGLSCVA